MLKANNLGFAWDCQQLFSNLTFKVNPGAALLVSGSNGVGKSSLLKILTGLVLASEGTITWAGKQVKPGDPNFLSHLLYIGHKMGIQPALTPIQNLQWLLGLCGKSVLAEINFVLNTVGLSGFENSPCERLSKGQCQRVALARLWLNPPKYWVLDEPFTGLDEQGIALVQNKLIAHLKHGGILVMATHHKVVLDPFACHEIHLGEIAC